MAEMVDLSEALKQLRHQLEEAQQEGSDKAIRFLTKSIEVELSIAFKNEVEGGVGVNAWFVDLSGKGKVGSETGHKLTLTLEPVDRSGKPTPLSDRDD